MKDTPRTAEQYAQIVIHAKTLGFNQDSVHPHIFIQKTTRGPLSVDLSASGDSFEAVSKNVVKQLIEQIEFNRQ